MKMKINSPSIGALGAAAGLLLGAINVHAQQGPPPGSFDPAQMHQRMIKRIRQQLDVKEDSDWTLISQSIQKVMQARRALAGLGERQGPGFLGGPPPFAARPGGGPPPGFPPPNQDDQGGPGGPPPDQDAQAGPGGPPPGGPPPFMRPSSPELDALRTAVEQKASSAEIKAKLAQIKAARDKNEAELKKAQDDLRQILSVRQEAVATTLGLL